MTFVTVFRHVPRPIIGMIGMLQDPEFARFEAHLDWLETTGVLVERFDPSKAQQEVATRPAVQRILSAEGDRCLPLILVNESVVSRGTYLSRAQLAGRTRTGVGTFGRLKTWPVRGGA
jgi:hypothetical protein